MSELQQLVRDTSYLQKLHQALRDESGKPLLNSSVHEYQLFLELMFYHGRDRAALVSQTFNPIVYSKASLIDYAYKFLARNTTRIVFILADPSPILIHHPFIGTLQPFHNFDLRVIPDRQSSLLDVNFDIFDDFAYHLEPDRDMRRGVVAFGDHDGTAKLSELFMKIYELSIPFREQLARPQIDTKSESTNIYDT